MSETVVVGPVDAPLEIVDPAVAVDPAPTEEITEEVRRSRVNSSFRLAIVQS
jgi:hypothetical protein